MVPGGSGERVAPHLPSPGLKGDVRVCGPIGYGQYGFQERLNGVNRQPSNGQKFNRAPSKKGKFYRQRSKKQLLLAVKRFQGLSNLTISAVHFGLLALKESF